MKKWKKHAIPSIAVVMIGTAATGMTVSADSDDRYEELQEVNITVEESKEIALTRVPGTVEEVELEDEDGYLFYEVEVDARDGNEYEILIDAETGDVIAVESEDEDDRDDDDNGDGDDEEDDDNEHDDD
ncbi:PepSY domain-containing protein [Oceanobacillus profundus]|uniref:PepSY domain-containing protein n=1 Tax=Oceanobacillus profundus TaxID=372463 RepID=A0A417YNC6_9BACI|nr:PepSY domain-containing protein [Oceanobacillus profundus]MBR3119072.1 PepSY domain-containing protein [Oceanobacillus sp.]MCM3398242.1 PepSY domain-containing protein [Oceanobacillus profundus]RHW35073.1 hypothetical protein D1B32_00170 [Oceanobacillus profundus]